VDIVHFKHIAEHCRTGERIALCLSRNTGHRAFPRPRNTRQPIQQVQPRSCPDMFGHGALQMAGKARDKGVGRHDATARGEMG
jgi:hypothetical protein